jgi:hypothetical protein
MNRLIVFKTADESAAHTVKASSVNITRELKQLDEKFIPDTIARTANVIPVPATASVGQTIVVKSVDENGKPTEWEAVDLPSGGGNATQKTVLMEATAEEDVVDFRLPSFTDEQVDRILNAKSVFFRAEVLSKATCNFGIYYPKYYGYTEKFVSSKGGVVGSDVYPNFVGFFNNWGGGVGITINGVYTRGVNRNTTISHTLTSFGIYKGSYVRLECTSTDGVIPAGSKITVEVAE